MEFLARITQLFTKTSNPAHSSEEDQLWNAWLDLDKKRGPSDLLALLKSDVRKEFKYRALVVLFAHDLQNVPFRWDDKDRALSNYLFLSKLEVKGIPQELLSFAGELLNQNIDYVLSKKDKKVHESFFKYNKLILQFLAVLPEDDDLANRLFSRYHINDPVAYMNMEEASGYNPLRKIFCAEEVPNKWKVLADKQMRDRIVAEVEGSELPREYWEVALGCYTTHIQMSNYDGREGYSRELLASQIRFITELQGVEDYNRELFCSSQVVHIMGAIPGDELRETRHKLARLIVLRETEDYITFSVWDPKGREAADLILREFGAEDQELATKLNVMTTEANRREAENADTQRKQREEVDDLLNQMR